MINYVGEWVATLFKYDSGTVKRPSCGICMPGLNRAYLDDVPGPQQPLPRIQISPQFKIQPIVERPLRRHARES